VKALFKVVTRLFVRPYWAGQPPSRTVAIVVPLSARTTLSPEEELSLRHLVHFLGGYDSYFIVPPGVSMQRQGFRELHVPRKFFGSAAAHNRLLMWPAFYSAFREYEYILIYHLDSLVFSDRLLDWCRAGWDYVGAPWIPSDDTPWVKEPRVGNGGFTLMRVESALRVLYNRHCQRPVTFWADLVTRYGAFRRTFALFERLPDGLPGSRALARVAAHARRSENPIGWNNDFFWSFEAERYCPGFKVATVEHGLRFAFEAAPRTCFELNHRQLPFGCHAWTRFDRAFWEPYLLDTADTVAASRQ
jgi:hypothetical protein